ncbi:hypothetical protein QOT17_003296 [Balamuthia mandrillaris]
MAAAYQLIFFVGLLVCPLLAQVWVDSQSGCGASCDGSETKPFPSLKKALENRPQGEILVRSGTYTGSMNRDLTISSVSLTIRSTNGSASTVINCEEEGPAFFISSSAITIEGLTVKNCIRIGEVDERGKGGGGAFLLRDTFTVLRDVVMENNEAQSEFDEDEDEEKGGYGGALNILSNSVELHGVHISGSKASFDGGAVYLQSANLKVLEDSVVDDEQNSNSIYCTSGSVQIDSSSELRGDPHCQSCHITFDTGEGGDVDLCPASHLTGLFWSASSLSIVVLLFTIGYFA